MKFFDETMTLMPPSRKPVRFYGAYLCRYRFFASKTIFGCRFPGPLLKAQSGPIFENRILKPGGPHAGSVLGVALPNRKAGSDWAWEKK
jgi:hypothetical protein